jgi:hypothetical protein
MFMKTKRITTIGINKKLYEILDNNIKNKSNYIEWLIYNDLYKNGKNVEKIII